jgi:hypothetical protein
MSTAGYIRFFLISALVLGAASKSSGSIVLDWSTVTWPAGSLNNSFDVDPGSPGNDLNVVVSGDTAQFLPSFTPPNPQTPAISQTFQGGFGSTVNSLELRVDYANQSQQVTVTISFAAYAQGVNNVSFTLFDIDKGTYQDQIRGITALSTDGVTLIAPTITNVGAAVALSGSGTAQVLDGILTAADTGAASGDGNATISFGPTPLQSITFTYGSGTATQADPTSQKIGLYNIDFTPVPEINPALASILVCLGAIGFKHLSRRAPRRN